MSKWLLAFLLVVAFTSLSNCELGIAGQLDLNDVTTSTDTEVTVFLSPTMTTEYIGTNEHGYYFVAQVNANPQITAIELPDSELSVAYQIVVDILQRDLTKTYYLAQNYQTNNDQDNYPYMLSHNYELGSPVKASSSNSLNTCFFFRLDPLSPGTRIDIDLS